MFKKLNSPRTDKAHGPDDISSRILAQIAEQIAHPVYLIFRKSLDESTLPSDWKAANVSPIHKNGNKNNAANYRPISLTSQICKVMESLKADTRAVSTARLDFNECHVFKKLNSRRPSRRATFFSTQPDGRQDGSSDTCAVSTALPRLTNFCEVC